MRFSSPSPPPSFNTSFQLQVPCHLGPRPHLPVEGCASPSLQEVQGWRRRGQVLPPLHIPAPYDAARLLVGLLLPVVPWRSSRDCQQHPSNGYHLLQRQRHCESQQCGSQKRLVCAPKKVAFLFCAIAAPCLLSAQIMRTVLIVAALIAFCALISVSRAQDDLADYPIKVRCANAVHPNSAHALCRKSNAKTLGSVLPSALRRCACLISLACSNRNVFGRRRVLISLAAAPQQAVH